MTLYFIIVAVGIAIGITGSRKLLPKARVPFFILTSVAAAFAASAAHFHIGAKANVFGAVAVGLCLASFFMAARFRLREVGGKPHV